MLALGAPSLAAVTHYLEALRDSAGPRWLDKFIAAHKDALYVDARVWTAMYRRRDLPEVGLRWCQQWAGREDLDVLDLHQVGLTLWELGDHQQALAVHTKAWQCGPHHVG